MALIIYHNLEDQLVAYLSRRGPQTVTLLAQGVRHNADSHDVKTVLADNPALFLQYITERHSRGRVYRTEWVKLNPDAPLPPQRRPEVPAHPHPHPHPKAPKAPASHSPEDDLSWLA